jgi:hypothetical protein
MLRAPCKRSCSVFGLALFAGTIVPQAVSANERTAAVSLDFRSPPAPGQPAALELGVAARVPLRGVHLDLRTRGAVRLLDDAEPPPGSLDAGNSHRQVVGVWVGDQGRGEITAALSGIDADDQPFTRTVTLYVIVDEAGVAVGSDGFALLERQRLDLLRGRGLVKPADYDRRLRRLLVAAPAERS